ncbi:hypothetical protein [Acidovorax sp.]|uniref:hypothetical protein n=1 Tax=Acidovorax sp. TaxID=1872122 RepID=UPI002583D660|nr:hypothetical protein [Acidovorax sp.]
MAMHTVKLIQVGNSVAAIFPKGLLARLQLEKGGELYATETPDGLRITTHNPEARRGPDNPLKAQSFQAFCARVICAVSYQKRADRAGPIRAGNPMGNAADRSICQGGVSAAWEVHTTPRTKGP